MKTMSNSSFYDPEKVTNIKREGNDIIANCLNPRAQAYEGCTGFWVGSLIFVSGLVVFIISIFIRGNRRKKERKKKKIRTGSELMQHMDIGESGDGRDSLSRGATSPHIDQGDVELRENPLPRLSSTGGQRNTIATHDSENAESWEVHHDDNYDLDYYVSDHTGRTTWTKPTDVFELQ